MVSVTTRGLATRAQEDSLFSLIETQGVLRRLLAELAIAWREIKRDPLEFITEFITADTRDSKRRSRLYAGLACAAVAHLALLGIILIAGLRHLAKQPKHDPDLVVTMVPLEIPGIRSDGPSKPAVNSKGDNGKGGGGGGNHDPRPVFKGPLPPIVATPQIVGPKPSPIDSPSLPVDTTLVGVPDNRPPEPHPGDPNGKSGSPSSGSGAGGGMGSGDGTGIGGGGGPGAGRGKGGNQGGGDAGPLDGKGIGIREIDWPQHDKIAGFSRITWIYRPRPIVTPQAQADKVVGTVVLRATFHADGTISDIEVVNPVNFMTEAAIESLRRSKFHPASLYGVPITLKRAPVTVEVHY